MAFDRWTPQITTAGDEGELRRLVGEIGVWRAKHLGDIPAQREATFAISNLWQRLGERDRAVNEARSLLSLCVTTPEASREEHQHARTWLTGLGEKAPDLRAIPDPRRDRRDRQDRDDRPRRGDRPERPERSARTDRPERPERPDRPERPAPVDRGLEKITAAHGRLVEALALDGDERDRKLVSLERWLRQAAGLPAPVRPPRVEEPVTPEDGPLAALVGRKLPGRREPRVRALEKWLAENPSRADELASLALEDHVATSGADVPAPWLVGFVAQGLATGGARTTAALEALTAKGAAAVAVYSEAPFQRALALVRTIPARFAGLRRGVLGRQQEPEERRAWTLRLDGGERMLVVSPESSEAYPAELAAAVAERLPFLCPRVVVLAPGAGNAPLREAVAAAGFLTLDGAPSDRELIAALDRVNAVEAPARPERPEREPREPRAEREPREPKAEREPRAPRETAPAGPPPIAAMEALLTASARPSIEALTEAFRGLEKLRDAFLAADRLWSPLPADASARFADLLAAGDAAAPDGLRVPEALTLGLKIGVSQGGPAVAALTNGSTGERFGGPGMSDLVGVVKAAGDAGFTVRRAFRGTTRRERRNNPVLSELSGALDGVWRLGMERESKRIELWFVAELPVEGRAAVPQLLLEERERVVVLPIDAGLMSWYAGIGGPEAIGWTGDDPGAVTEALNGLA